MNESKKTLAFVVAAMAMLLVAWASRPKPITVQAGGEAGQKLFPEFRDPLAAKRLEITTYDEDTATLDRFEVAQVNGIWSIPSKQNYPADAQEHMAQAATSLLDLEILKVASTQPSSHEMYGVVDPQDPSLKAGTTGVGTRVDMRDASDKALATLIIGKEVKDQPSLRYVRHGGKGRDQVYVVKLDSSKLTTRFGDWIEKDLLKLNTLDIAQVSTNDYSIETQLQGGGVLGLVKDENSKITLKYDNSKSQWSVAEMKTHDDSTLQWIDDGLKEDEELNNDKLSDLKFALDDLKIVDVERKPEGLSADLQADKAIYENQQSMQSLIARGFYPFAPQQGQEKGEVLSSQGDIVVGTAEGVEYVLRFGEMAGTSSEAGEKAGAQSSADPSGTEDTGVSRYLLVMAQFNPDLIPQPKLEPLPEEAKSTAESSQEESTGVEKPADAAAAEEGKSEEAPQTEAAASGESESDGSENDGEGEAADAEAKGDAEQTEAKAETAENAEEPAISTRSNPSAEDRAALEKQKREQVARENERKQKEYEEKVKQGQERVKELNARFAQWYYVISDGEYRKIHLTRADLIKPKEQQEEPQGEGSGLGDFNALKNALGQP